MKNRGQIAIHALLSIAALISAIGVPIFWASGLQATNTIQDDHITTLEANYAKLEGKLDIQNDKLNALLVRQGIDPNNIKRGQSVAQ